MSDPDVDVNVADGFLPSFAAEFRGHYGEASEFVRAVSDLFPLALAQMLQRAGKLHDPSAVAIFSDEHALSALRELVAAVQSVKQPLFREALGFVPIGSVESSVSSAVGPSVFPAWPRSFQPRQFEACRALLCRPS